MSVFHSALRFICMYVFTSFSLWVCTDIYIETDISYLSSPLSTHPFFCQVSFTSLQTIQSLSLSKYWRLQRQVEWGKWGNIYVFMCACLTLSVEHGKILDVHGICDRMTKRSEHMTLLWQMCKLWLCFRASNFCKTNGINNTYYVKSTTFM